MHNEKNRISLNNFLKKLYANHRNLAVIFLILIFLNLIILNRKVSIIYWKILVYKSQRYFLTKINKSIFDNIK